LTRIGAWALKIIFAGKWRARTDSNR